jgi:hypothetical protein
MAPEPLPQSEPEPKTQIEPSQSASPALEPFRTPITPDRLTRAELRLKSQQSAFAKTVAAGWVVVAIIYAALYIYSHQTR